MSIGDGTHSTPNTSSQKYLAPHKVHCTLTHTYNSPNLPIFGSQHDRESCRSTIQSSSQHRPPRKVSDSLPHQHPRPHPHTHPLHNNTVKHSLHAHIPPSTEQHATTQQYTSSAVRHFTDMLLAVSNMSIVSSSNHHNMTTNGPA